MSQTTCAHEPCDCQAVNDSGFCSDACRQAHENGDMDCPCPHGSCDGHAH